MEKFYMVKTSDDYFEYGSLVKCDDNKLTLIDPINVDIPNDRIACDDWIELPSMKSKFLAKQELDKRIDIHNTGLFEKIEQLNVDDECVLSGSQDKHRIIKRTNNGFVVQAEGGTARHVSILDVESIVNKNYYICVSKHENDEVGTIISEEQDAKLPVHIGNDKLRMISEEEALFLKKCPFEERITIYKDRLLDKIKLLNEGDFCFLRMKPDSAQYKITKKFVKDGSIKFVLLSRNKKIVRVDYSEVRLETAPVDESDKMNMEDSMNKSNADNISDISTSVDETNEATDISFGKVNGDTLYQYMPIPECERKFKEIDMDSTVIYYFPKRGILDYLYGTVKWSGMDVHGEYWYGIELENNSNEGTDEIFNSHRLFQFDRGFGILASVERVAPDTRFIEMNYYTPPSEISSREQFCIPTKCWKGENYGIQGNKDSCFLVALIFSLFAKSHLLDFMISPIYNAEEEDEVIKDLRSVMAYNIIYPLREFGFVSYHHIDEMKDVVRRLGGRFVRTTHHEIDSEDLSIILARLCPQEPLISLRSFSGRTSNVTFLQLIVSLKRKVRNISSLQLLEVSMAQNDIMFDKPPTCLIMQADRAAIGSGCFDNVLPLNSIEISHLCSPYRKKCLKCQMGATYQCKTCIDASMRITCGFWCDIHKCDHDEIRQFASCNSYSQSEVYMHLKSIICLEDGYFVTYVKEDELTNNWILFDRSCFRKFDGTCVPKVTLEGTVSNFLNLSNEDMKDREHLPDKGIDRIVKNSHIFVYHNTTKTCY